MTARRHDVAFRGSVVPMDQLTTSPHDLVITDLPELHASRALTSPVVPLARIRPRLSDVIAIRRAVVEHRPERVVAVGGGAVMDAAKRARHDEPGFPPLALVPAGAEPWRAFAPFGVVVEESGSQDTVGSQAMGTTEVLLVQELLTACQPEQLLLSATDMLVCACESLLSNRSQPYSTAHAEAGAAILIESIQALLEGATPEAERIVVASALVTDAFSSTGLGLAHAVSTHCASLMLDTQEAINAVVGRSVVERWGRHPRLRRLSNLLGTANDADALETLLRRANQRLGLDTLAATGVVHGDVELALPRILTSSGIAHLPEALDEGSIAQFVRELVGEHECSPMSSIEHVSEIPASAQQVFSALADVEGRSRSMTHVERVEVLESNGHRRLVQMHETVEGNAVTITSRFVLDPPRSMAYEHVGERPFGPNRGRYEIVEDDGRCVLKQTHHTCQDLDARPALRDEWTANMRRTHALIGELARGSEGPVTHSATTPGVTA